MSDELGSIKVSIFGREYNVKGGSDEEYVKRLAGHVDSVMRDIADKTGSISSGRIAILAALNIADEMFKEQERLTELAEELSQKLEAAMSEKAEQPETDT